MKVEIDPQELKFVEEYVKKGNLVDAIQVAFPSYGDKPPKDCLIKGKAVLRRYAVAKKLNELFDEASLSPKLILRSLFEEIVDPSEKHPRLAAIKLGSELLGMKTEKVDLNIQGKSDDEIRAMILANLNKKKEEDASPGNKPGPAKPEPTNQSRR